MSQLYQALKCSTQHCKITGIQTQPYMLLPQYLDPRHVYLRGEVLRQWIEQFCPALALTVPITRVMADINTPTTLSGDSSKSLEDSFLSTDEDSLAAR